MDLDKLDDTLNEMNSGEKAAAKELVSAAYKIYTSNNLQEQITFEKWLVLLKKSILEQINKAETSE